MYLLLLLGTISFGLAFALTPLCRDLFLRFGLVDQPDHERKIHSRGVPRIGGVPVALAYVVPIAIVFLSSFSHTAHLGARLPFRWEFPLAAFVVFATGLIDDVHGLRPWQKLLAHHR